MKNKTTLFYYGGMGTLCKRGYVSIGWRGPHGPSFMKLLWFKFLVWKAGGPYRVFYLEGATDVKRLDP